MAGRRRIAWLGGVVAIAACFPSYEVGGGDGGAGSDGAGLDGTAADGTVPPDGGLDATSNDAPGSDATSGDAPHDGGPSDTGPQSDGPSPPPTGSTVVIADGGAVAAASGTAQQQHLLVVGGNYWFFYYGADDALVRTRWSSDFVHWNDGASLTLPMTNDGEGRNLAVATRRIGGVDVVHVATSLHQSPKRVVWDTRAVVSGTTITFGKPVQVHDLDTLDTWVDAESQAPAGSQGGTYCDPDGTGVAITDDGIVHVATAWVSVPNCCACDSNFTQSNAPDQGSSWNADAGFVSPMQHYTVGGSTHGRQLVSLSGGAMLAGWDWADSFPYPTEVVWAAEEGGLWTQEDLNDSLLVFPYDPTVQSQNDWSFCRIDDAHVHALRRSLTGEDAGDPSRVFEDYVFDGTSLWEQAGILADDEGVTASGVVLLTNGTELLAAAIADDAQRSIRYATWNGTVWGAWATAVGPGADGGTVNRSFLASSGCADPAHPVLTWTEGTTAPYTVVGMGVGSLFP